MRVVVLGAGVVGVTTACYLAKRGYEVEVVDRADAVASSASHANGGQLSYSFTDALARPGMIGKLPGLLCGFDPAIRIRPSSNFMRWALGFVGQCTRRNHEQNTIAVLKLALQSASLMDELTEELDFDFSQREAGKLVLMRSPAELAAARRTTSLKNRHGCNVTTMTMQQAFEIEPVLRNMRSGYAGAVYSADDHVGDARKFSQGLADHIRDRYGVCFRLGQEALGLRLEYGRVTGVRLPNEVLSADAVIVCLGAWTTGFLGSTRPPATIVPVRGYSVTLPEGRHAPRVSVSDLEHRIVFSSLDGKIRIAGFADFLGFNDGADAKRIELLLGVARSIAPEVADYTAATRHEWGGFRPMTANSRPIVGPVAIPGLYVNSGHGMLGWTLACATGYNVAQLLAK